MQENLEKDKGTILKEARIKKGITQEQLANKINYTRQYISKWENNISFPKDIQTLKKLSNLLSISLKELLPEDYLIIHDDNIEKNTDKKENHAQNKLSKKFLMALTLLIIILIGITVYIFKTNTYMINANTFTGVFLNNIQK